MKKLGSRQNPAVVRVRTEEEALRVMGLCQERGWQVIVGVEPDEEEDLADLERLEHAPKPAQSAGSPGRNDPCPCGSGRKFKRCCLARVAAEATSPLELETGISETPAG